MAANDQERQKVQAQQHRTDRSLEPPVTAVVRPHPQRSQTWLSR